MSPRRTVRQRATSAPARKKPAPEDFGTPLEQFVGLSSVLTGFSETELHGTGMMPVYFALIPSIIGPDFFGRLLTRWANIRVRGGGDEALIEGLIAPQLLDDPTLGPIARNLATLWYLGMWYQLPADWRNTHGAWAGDVTFVVSPQAYVAGLVWPAIHSHPPAAKQPGYGSWALPPEGARL